MQEETDYNNPLTMPLIIKRLAEFDILAQRKALYDDLSLLNEYGITIERRNVAGRMFYWTPDRTFSHSELSILIDEIKSSKYLTEKKSDELIRKLSSLTNNYNRNLTNREVFVTNRIKNKNDSIYENADTLHLALINDKKVCFRYYFWNENKEREFKKDGDFYEVSPWALVVDNENYYLLAYDEQDKIIKHYRVDKMVDIDTVDEPRLGKECFDAIDMKGYTQSHFRMFGGEMKSVVLKCKNEMANVLIDQFGFDAEFKKVDSEYFNATVNVAVSPQFFGWVLSLGKAVSIVAPKEEVAGFVEYLEDVRKQYN